MQQYSKSVLFCKISLKNLLTQIMLFKLECYVHSSPNLTVNIYFVLKALLTASVISVASNYTNCYNISLGRYCFTTPTYMNGVTWNDANRWCTSRGLTLPVIINADVQLAIERFIRESGSALLETSDTPYYIWLDATLGIYNSSNWYWVNGKSYSGMFVNNNCN